MATASIQTFKRFSELAPALAVQVLSYTPVTALASVSKAFRGLQEKLMEQIWIGMKSNPLLAERVRALSPNEFSTLCFKALLNKQRTLAERTPTGFNAFQKQQLLEAGSYGQTRFEKSEPIISAVDKEQDNNLWKVWIANQGLRDTLVAFLGDAPPQNAAEIRTWMNKPENQAHLDTIRVWLFNDLGLTAFPQELSKCRRLAYLFGKTNSIRELPDWFSQFTMLEQIYVRENLLERIPEFLLRMPNLEWIDMRANPIRTLSEVHYHHFYTWQMWLGFGFFNGGGSILHISASELTEMPFSAYLEKPCSEFALFLLNKWKDLLRIVEEFRDHTSSANLQQIWASFFGNSEPSRLLGKLCSDVLALVCSISEFIFIMFSLSVFLSSLFQIWLLSRVYLWAVVPAATWIREMLGYGRMITV